MLLYKYHSLCCPISTSLSVLLAPPITLLFTLSEFLSKDATAQRGSSCNQMYTKMQRGLSAYNSTERGAHCTERTDHYCTAVLQHSEC